MPRFNIGDKVKLKPDVLIKYPMLRRHNVIYFSKYGTVISIAKSNRRHIRQFCMIKFIKGQEFHVVDLPSTLLVPFNEDFKND